MPDLPLALAVAKPATELPVEEGRWSYEMKLDGYRMLVHVPAGVLRSRRGSDLTSRFPDILAAARELGPVVLDGELVAVREDGPLDFAALGFGARRRHVENIGLVYAVFDLLGARGRDLRSLPYRERRARLESVLNAHRGSPVQLIAATQDHTKAEGWISAERAQVGIDGVVAKPTTSHYPLRTGRKSGWVKVKYVEDIDAIVVGVLGPITAPVALVLGPARRGKGRARPVAVSSTLSRQARESLADRLRRLPGQTSPAVFSPGLPGAEPVTYTPVRPEVVVEVRADAAIDRYDRFRHPLHVIRAKVRE